ncbi:ABC transporter permease subunit [Rosettibacter firmus]|uniref:ABC transporter permease subunit n=1 Tax=Rosettibacter firmus TaxID=3111522 RepID=UPI00336BCC09
MNNINNKQQFYFLITIIFVYVMLFEFVLPVNKVLPRPTLLVEAFFSIWKDYNLLYSMALTTTSIYLSLALGSIIMMFISKKLLYYLMQFKDLFDSIKFYKYIPFIFLIVIFIYWFQDSIIAEFMFGLVYVFALLKISLFEELKNIDEYYIVAKNMGLDEKEIHSKVIFKTLQPALFEKIIQIHFSLWGIILIYEFIDGNGFGGVYSKILYYNDFSAIFVLTIIITFLIWIGNLLLKFIQLKYYFWEK